MSAPHPPESPLSSHKGLPPNFIFLPATTLLVVILLFGLQAVLTPGSHQEATLSTDLNDNAHRQQKVAQEPTPKTADQLPIIAQLRDFTFVERSGKKVVSSDIHGKVWVADFIFTACQAECPLMNVEMQKIQRKFPTGDVKMLSFSVDPETDTPERLRDYATQFEAGEHWLFFTGDRQDLHHFAINDFKLSVQPLDTDPSHEHHGGHAPAAKGTSPFLHSQKFVLLDEQQRIRGYYDSTDPTDIKQLIEVDIPALLAAAS